MKKQEKTIFIDAPIGCKKFGLRRQRPTSNNRNSLNKTVNKANKMMIFTKEISQINCKLLNLSLVPISIWLMTGCDERLPKSIYISSDPPQTQFKKTQSSEEVTVQVTNQVQTVANQTNKATEERVYLAEGRVSFLPPPGFTQMTPEEIALKFPGRSGNSPQYVYANDSRNVSIAITFSESQVSEEQLPEFKNVMEQFMEKAIPNIKWVTKDFALINNQRWVQLEFISSAIDTEIHNNTYLTSFDGKMLGFNFNSTVEQYNTISAELLKSRNSIMINQ